MTQPHDKRDTPDTPVETRPSHGVAGELAALAADLAHVADIVRSDGIDYLASRAARVGHIVGAGVAEVAARQVAPRAAAVNGYVQAHPWGATAAAAGVGALAGLAIAWLARDQAPGSHRRGRRP